MRNLTIKRNKSADAYWQISFATDLDNAQEARTQYWEFARSVTFE